MAQAARAYQQQPQRRIHEVQRPPLRVVPGRPQHDPALKPLGSLAWSCFKIAIVVMLFLGLVLAVRVAITTQIVSTMMASEQSTEQIAEARAVGLELEVQHAIAPNPTHIQEIAGTDLGMAPATTGTYLDISNE